MNGSTDLCSLYAKELDPPSAVDVWVLPSALHLERLILLLSQENSSLQAGIQNSHAQASGAFTGEISAMMAAQMGATSVIVGHSERRILFEETDMAVAGKFVAAQQAGLVPILCVGESRSERENGAENSVVQRQINAVARIAGAAAFENAVIAYEPVWAIGTGLTATPAQAQATHRFIRTIVASLAPDMRLLYGGSVKPDNAAALSVQPDIDGFLVGGASLVLDDFAAICRHATTGIH